nr:hypothetical protein [Geminicoccus flavidas]
MTKMKKVPTPPSELAGQIAHWKDKPDIAGLGSGAATLNVLNHMVSAAFLGAGASLEMREWKQRALLDTILAMGPRDPIEGQLMAQMIAANEATMECYRRAALPDQTFEGRQMALGHANKLARTYATLVETLNRHRGKGQQTVRVEHVTVQAGGQAIVGNVTAGSGDGRRSIDQAHTPALADAGLPTLRGQDPTRDRMPRTSGPGQEALPDAWRSEGERGPERAG